VAIPLLTTTTTTTKTPFWSRATATIRATDRGGWLSPLKWGIASLRRKSTPRWLSAPILSPKQLPRPRSQPRPRAPPAALPRTSGRRSPAGRPPSPPRRVCRRRRRRSRSRRRRNSTSWTRVATTATKSQVMSSRSEFPLCTDKLKRNVDVRRRFYDRVRRDVNKQWCISLGYIYDFLVINTCSDHRYLYISSAVRVVDRRRTDGNNTFVLDIFRFTMNHCIHVFSAET